MSIIAGVNRRNTDSTTSQLPSPDRGVTASFRYAPLGRNNSTQFFTHPPRTSYDCGSGNILVQCTP